MNDLLWGFLVVRDFGKTFGEAPMAVKDGGDLTWRGTYRGMPPAHAPTARSSASDAFRVASSSGRTASAPALPRWVVAAWSSSQSCCRAEERFENSASI